MKSVLGLGFLLIVVMGCIYGAWLCGKAQRSQLDNVTLKETVDRDAQTIHNLEFELKLTRAGWDRISAGWDHISDRCYSVTLELITLQEAYDKLKAQRSYLDEYYKRGEVVIQGR